MTGVGATVFELNLLREFSEDSNAAAAAAACALSREYGCRRRGVPPPAGPLFLAEDADGFDACGAVSRQNGGEYADRQEEQGDGSEGERVGGADAENEGDDDAAKREGVGDAAPAT